MYCGSRDIEDTYHFSCICPCYTTLVYWYVLLTAICPYLT